MKNPVIYVFLNKSLEMSTGKAASQAAHAAAQSIANNDNMGDNIEWATAIHKTVIVLQARDEAHLRNIQDYLAQRTIKSQLVIDEGVNEIPSHTITALVTPIMEKNEDADKLMSTFALYNDRVDPRLEDMIGFIRNLSPVFPR